MKQTQLSFVAPDPLTAEVEWTQKNPEAWQAIVRWAHEDRAAGYAPSTRLYLCLLRRPHFASVLGLTRKAGEPVLVNDHGSSGLARLLNRKYPELKVPTREAMVDSWPGVEREAS